MRSLARALQPPTVSRDGKPTDVNEIATWSGGIRIAAFSSPEAAKSFAESLGVPVSWRPFDESQWRKDQADVKDFIRGKGK
jgi:hypothetical protein